LRLAQPQARTRWRTFWTSQQIRGLNPHRSARLSLSVKERLEPVLMIESWYFVARCHTAYLIPRMTFPLGWSVSKYA
jgi:hypothetical protein